MGHHCCVPNCNSNSRFGANSGVTFHAFPVDPKERKQWILSVKRADYKKLTVNRHTKVCSKHFLDEDFIQPQFCKRRMLKKGVVPSVFLNVKTEQEDPQVQKRNESSSEDSATESTKSESKMQKIEESTRIKKNLEMKNGGNSEKVDIELPKSKNSEKFLERKVKDRSVMKETAGLNISVANTIMPNPSCSSPTKSDDSEQGSVSDTAPTNGSSPNSCNSGTPNRKTGSVNFQIGTRLEAKDLGNEMWYPVKVVEVDWDDEEVLIHFEKWSQRYDEWVPMDSSRLRPTQNPNPPNESKSSSKVFNVGDRVMAKWSDCRRYPAKVKAVLGNDRYEVLFFDGFTKNIKGVRMTKLDEDSETIGEIGPSSLEEFSAPIIEPIVKNEVISEAIGTKEERRERKRKLNVMELFHPKKRLKLEAEASSPKSPSETDKGRRLDRGKRRKENEDDEVDRSEDADTSFRKKKKELSDGSSKTEQKSESINETDKTESSETWVDDGQSCIVESADGPRKTTVVPDKNLPPGWSKHTLQRKHGNSAGKWDVFLVSPQGRKFRSRNELRLYFEEIGEPFRSEKFDFCLSGKKRRSRTSEDITPVRRRLSHGGSGRLRGVSAPSEGEVEEQSVTPPQQPSLQPQRRVKTLLPKVRRASISQSEDDNREKLAEPSSPPPPYTTTVAPVPAVSIQTEMLEGEVLVGGLKIQMENNTFKCPKESCGKNFRKENLLQMHIKHYHPEYNKFMGSTPNVADLAYARTIGESIDDLMPKARYSTIGHGSIGNTYLEKVNRFETTRKSKTNISPGAMGGKTVAVGGGIADVTSPTEKKKITAKEKLQSALVAKKAGKGFVTEGEGRIPSEDAASESKELGEDRSADVDNLEQSSSPTSEILTGHKEEKKEPQTTIKTLLPVIRSPSHAQESSSTERLKNKFPTVEEGEEYVEVIDVGSRHVPPSHTSNLQITPQLPAASTPGTTAVTKSLRQIRRRRQSDFHFEPLYKRRKIASKLEVSEDVDVVDDGAAFMDTTGTGAATNGTVSSGKSTPTYRYSRKKTPVVHLEKLNITTDSNAESSSSTVEQLRKEELINCTCGFMEEDGLMIQCDLCLCWQHGLCNNIEKETDVPEKYVCPICLNPYRQRKSKKYLHDQDWLKEGKLPSLTFRSKNDSSIQEREAILKRSHDLTGSLLQMQQVLHSLRVKVNIAEKPDHPKLYLWARNWEKDGDSSLHHTSSQTQMVPENELKSQIENIIPCRHDSAKQEPNVVSDTKEVMEKSTLPASEDSIIKNEENINKSHTRTDIDKSENKQDIVKESIAELDIAAEVSLSSSTAGNDAGNTENKNLTENSKPEPKNEDNPMVPLSSSVEESKNVTSNMESSGTAPKKSIETDFSDSKMGLENRTSNIGSLEVMKNDESETKSHSTEKLIKEEETSDENVKKEDQKSIEGKDKNSIESKSEISSSKTLSDDIAVPADKKPTEESVKPDTEEKSVNAEEKPTDKDETTRLENHGLLHQALTNGSQAANSLNQLDTSDHPMLQLPICQSELMQFASSMADNLRMTEPARQAAPETVTVPVPEPPRAPQPEAPIDPVECRLSLLDHIEHFQTQIDTRLTTLEEQVAALEAQDPDAAKDEGPEFYPQTKQTIQMLLRDLLTIRRIAALN